ncbi:MAG TPA: UDP-N-acetylmuramoyl-tripeptide--D-alanyl-D-alanine ligase, partial [Marinilabiliaceae bacterium]|nr:UDP-N-acetylmuramoyl-tripeptide--D-alanyl-D-alanine ligase [Marinilabiliaceae bacterium]
LYNSYLKSGKVTTDSRHTPLGSIYFALKGDRFDGNDFALSALEAGCALAVVDDVRLKDTEGCFWVSDALKTLQKLATHHRVQSGMKVLGITGSNGKTTTKELVAAVLSQKYKMGFTQGNLNNHIGVPLTLLSMPKDVELAVVEMGANHINEISFLCEIAQPDWGLITNVGKAHLEGFGSFEGVMTAKSELYAYLKKHKKPIFINDDNPFLTEMLAGYNISLVKYGTTESLFVRGKEAKAEPFLEFEWKSLDLSWQKTTMQLSGLYNFENALAAVAIGRYFEVSAAEINKALEDYQPKNHRSQVVKTKQNTLFLDAYNANPTSMAAALDNFEKTTAYNKILVLGGMKELGSESKEEHLKLVNRLKNTSFTQCFLVGEEFQEILPKDKRFYWFSTGEELCRHLKNNSITDNYILVKGSRANKLEEVVDFL